MMSLIYQQFPLWRTGIACWLPLAALSGFLCVTLGAAENAAIEGGSAEEKAAGLPWSLTPDPALPNVLILGDSISIGYTLLVRAELRGVANVVRPIDTELRKPINCGDTARGIANLDAWLGTSTWRIIHFNFGLHDLKYLDAKGKYVAPEFGKQVAPLVTYEAHVRTLVAQLKKTGAILIWGSTTPVPGGANGRVKGDEIAYNAVALRVMRENGVLINDLHAAVADRSSLQKPNNVHFTDQGSAVLAASVVASITTALTKPWFPSVPK